MDSYTLIFVRDQRARPVQVAIPKQRVKQAMIGAAVALLVGAVLVWDYWRLRADNAELAELRVEAMEQREQITVFRNRLVEVDAAMSKVGELERKVRIIANLLCRDVAFDLYHFELLLIHGVPECAPMRRVSGCCAGHDARAPPSTFDRLTVVGVHSEFSHRYLRSAP